MYRKQLFLAGSAPTSGFLASLRREESCHDNCVRVISYKFVLKLEEPHTGAWGQGAARIRTHISGWIFGHSPLQTVDKVKRIIGILGIEYFFCD